MSADLEDQLRSYGAWIERSVQQPLTPNDVTTGAAPDTVVELLAIPPRSTGGRPRHLALAAAVLVAVALAAGVLVLTRRSNPSMLNDRPDPPDALLLLPEATDGLTLANRSAWAGTPTPEPGTPATVSVAVIGRRTATGYTDVATAGVTRSRPVLMPQDSWTTISTSRGDAFVTKVGAGFVVAQQRDTHWLEVTTTRVSAEVQAALLDLIVVNGDDIELQAGSELEIVERYRQSTTATEYNSSFTATRSDGTTFTVETATSPSVFGVVPTGRFDRTTVNGRAAWLVSLGAAHAVMWQETPNRVVTVFTEGDDSGLLAFAATLREVSEPEWSEAIPST